MKNKIKKAETAEIEVGTIVEYKGGFHRVKSMFSTTVNLCSVFGGYITEKKVLKSEIVEAEEAFYAKWRKSESYQCM